MPTYSSDTNQYHYNGYVVVPGVETGAIVKGIRGLAFDDRVSGSAECRTCEEGPACVEQGYATVTRVLDDNACLSPFANWFKSEKFGRLDVEVSYCGKSTALCFEGFACKLERHDLKQCDNGLAYETLTIKTSKAEDKIVAPVIMPRKPCARLVTYESLPTALKDEIGGTNGDMYICFDVSLAGGCIDNADFCVRNLLPLGTGFVLEDPSSWGIVAGPAPGSISRDGVSTYSSPKKRVYTFYHLFIYEKELTEASLHDRDDGSNDVQALWDEKYAEWYEETKLELLFKAGVVEVSTCLELELPPRSTRVYVPSDKE